MISIDREIQHLVLQSPSGILSREDASKLLTLKSWKEKLLAHEVMTWRLKSRVVWIELEDANTVFSKLQ